MERAFLNKNEGEWKEVLKHVGKGMVLSVSKHLIFKKILDSSGTVDC